MKPKYRVVAGLMIALLIFLAGCEAGSDDRGRGNDSFPDVAVIGSEIEGMYLARAAKDEGLSVVILDPRNQPGGQLVQGEMHFLDEPEDDSRQSLLQGRVKELFDRYKRGDIRLSGEFAQYFHSLIEDIPLESGITIVGIKLAPEEGSSRQRIESITYRDAAGKEKTLQAKYWVENTDFGALSGKLALKRIPGIETVFGGEKDYMAASMMMKFRHVDWDKFRREFNRLSKQEAEEKYGTQSTVTDKFTWGFGHVGARYTPSSKEVFLRGLNAIHLRDGEVLINALLVYNVDPSSPESVERALALGKAETEKVLPHLRQELPGWEEAELNGFPNYLYIRDFDRYETEYVLQAADLMSGTMFWDNVSIAGYPIDLQGTMSHNWGLQVGDPDKYGMPLRSFIPKGYANAIVAGKNVGASAVAYGSARIQPNTALAAEVIGIMLGRLKGEPGLAELTEQDMKEMHSYIAEKYGIILSGVKGANKIEHLSGEQIEQLNQGKLTLHD
ncbi:FAD-dependent oxidoreductase [Paenibacillus ginsengihumi]|uniref:FAD-dependent oxidoreductase n=1 Tax=Paenibacillus ginsengihumi TaxID=431596 RepID=UPI000378B7AE|nr:FAD-dependent oxidoreductase [Paenibacillus ginsengihumi]